MIQYRRFKIVDEPLTPLVPTVFSMSIILLLNTPTTLVHLIDVVKEDFSTAQSDSRSASIPSSIYSIRILVACEKVKTDEELLRQ